MAAPLMTKKEVAARLNMHPGSVMRMVRAGTFPRPLRTAGSWRGPVRWRAEDVEAWIIERVTAAQQPETKT